MKSSKTSAKTPSSAELQAQMDSITKRISGQKTVSQADIARIANLGQQLAANAATQKSAILAEADKLKKSTPQPKVPDMSKAKTLAKKYSSGKEKSQPVPPLPSAKVIAKTKAGAVAQAAQMEAWVKSDEGKAFVAQASTLRGAEQMTRLKKSASDAASKASSMASAAPKDNSIASIGQSLGCDKASDYTAQMEAIKKSLGCDKALDLSAEMEAIKKSLGCDKAPSFDDIVGNTAAPSPEESDSGDRSDEAFWGALEQMGTVFKGQDPARNPYLNRSETNSPAAVTPQLIKFYRQQTKETKTKAEWIRGTGLDPIFDTAGKTRASTGTALTTTKLPKSATRTAPPTLIKAAPAPAPASPAPAPTTPAPTPKQIFTPAQSDEMWKAVAKCDPQIIDDLRSLNIKVSITERTVYQESRKEVPDAQGRMVVKSDRNYVHGGASYYEGSPRSPVFITVTGEHGPKHAATEIIHEINHARLVHELIQKVMIYEKATQMKILDDDTLKALIYRINIDHEKEVQFVTEVNTWTCKAREQLPANLTHYTAVDKLRKEVVRLQKVADEARLRAFETPHMPTRKSLIMKAVTAENTRKGVLKQLADLTKSDIDADAINQRVERLYDTSFAGKGQRALPTVILDDGGATQDIPVPQQTPQVP